MILLSISLLAFIAAFFIYRKKPAQFALRAAAILLMYLLISNYVLRVNTGMSQRVPTILIDHSESMKNHMPQITESVSRLHFPHRSFFFQETLITEQEPDEFGSYTDITRALEESDKFRSSAIILITDGNHNSGISPLTALKDMATPVYVCGTGEEQVRDIEVIDLQAPAYAYRYDSIQIDVIVESSGFPSGEGRISVNPSSGENVANQTFPLSSTKARRSLRFVFTADVIGDLRVDVSVLPASGELSYENNKLSTSIKVIKDKIRVLYYTDHISFNTKFIRQYLSQDDNFSLSSLSRRRDDKIQIIENAAHTTAAPDPQAYDVIVLDNVNINKPVWSSVPEYVKGGKGLLLIGMIEGTDEKWAPLLPINTTGGLIVGNHQIHINEPFSVLKEEDYPPAKMIARAVGSKDDATIIAYAGNLPVIGYRREGKGAVYQISIIDLATWDFIQQGVRNRETVGPLIGDIVRFLSHFGQHDRLVLDAQRREYAIGETVDLTLQSYDGNLRQSGGGDFYLVAEDRTVPFYEMKNGVYETSIIYRNVGKHLLTAQGNLDGEKLTSNEVEITVTPRPVETELRINQNLLERIAAGTNGTFFKIDDLENIALPENGGEKIVRTMNFDSPLIYFLVFFILAVDWLLRRRRGIT